MNKEHNKFCRECGSRLIESDVQADKIEQHMYDSGGGTWWRLASSFDPDTGERNIARVFQCPKYERKWYGENRHDIFAVYRGDIEWGVRIKK